MKKIEPKLKHFLILQQSQKHQKNINYKNWKRDKNKQNQGLSVNQKKWLKGVSNSDIFKPPDIFSLRENAELVLRFLNQLKNHQNKNREVYINLVSVKIITNGSIAILLSVIQELNNKGIRVRGKKPKDKETKKIIEKSGFFNYVIGFIDEENSVSPDTIITKGVEVVEQESTAKIVLQAMKTVTGVENRNQPIQGMLIELMANSVNHAYPNSRKKKWVLSVNHDDINKKASFAFVDNGVGIIKTLNLNLSQKFEKLFNGNIDLLNTAFEGKIGSRTGLTYRGRGLPSVFNKYKQNCFKDFVVITNNVFIDFQNNKSILLENSFHGTFYYWELNQDCEYYGKNA